MVRKATISPYYNFILRSQGLKPHSILSFYLFKLFLCSYLSILFLIIIHASFFILNFFLNVWFFIFKLEYKIIQSVFGVAVVRFENSRVDNQSIHVVINNVIFWFARMNLTFNLVSLLTSAIWSKNDLDPGFFSFFKCRRNVENYFFNFGR